MAHGTNKTFWAWNINLPRLAAAATVGDGPSIGTGLQFYRRRAVVRPFCLRELNPLHMPAA